MADIVLVYDRQCPVCEHCVRLVRIRESVGTLRIVDAREPSAVLDEVTALGWDIDQGMVLKLGERLYYGADAIHALALIGSRSGIFNRLNAAIFGSRRLSAMLYPLLRACRNGLLKLLGRKRINNLARSGNDRF